VEHASYRTIAGPVRVEIDKIKGSRFLGDACPIADVGAADAALESVRAEFPDATHHCWAWRLDERTMRYGDDGEPSGSAGRPILNQIDGHDLVGVSVIVVRYFGGTKLGTGGLVRAYAAATRAALEAATIETRIIKRTFRVRHAYELSAPVQATLSAYALDAIEPTYGVDVTFRVSIPLAEADDFVNALTEATAGRVGIEDTASA
jgi:uncharacterized YigZ family protein